MPFLHNLTNTSVSTDDQDTLLTQASKLVSETLGKDEIYLEFANVERGMWGCNNTVF